MAAATISQEAKEAVVKATALLSQPQKTFDFRAANVEAAVALLSEHVASQPTAHGFWLALADAYLMQGKLLSYKDNLSRALHIMYPGGFAIFVEHERKNIARQRRNVEKSGTADLFSVLGAPFTRPNFDKVMASYMSLANSGWHDLRLRFYIFNLLKASDDLARAYAWLDCEELDDAFLAIYCQEYHANDHFDYQTRAWFQKRFFVRVGQASPLEPRSSLDVLYYTCLLHDAADNEQTAQAEEHAAEGGEWDSWFCEEGEEGEDGWTDEDAALFLINKETQMWRFLRANLLRMEGKLDLAQSELDIAIEAGHNIMVTLAARLCWAHIRVEQLKPQEAFETYDLLITDARLAADGMVISPSDPLLILPVSVESDAQAGKALCLRLLGRVQDAQACIGAALLADTFCGDAIWQKVTCDCMRNALSAAKSSMEALRKNTSVVRTAGPDLVDDIISRGPQMRSTYMGIDLIHPSEALVERRENVNKHDGRWTSELRRLAIEENVEQLWYLLFAFIAERRATDADDAITILMGINRSSGRILDLSAFVERNDIRKGKQDSAQNAMLAEFHMKRGNWFDKKLAMYNEAGEEYATALNLLSEEEARHRKIMWKIIWKQHRFHLRRERTESAISTLQECVRVSRIDFRPLAKDNDHFHQHANEKYAKYNFYLGSLYFRLNRVEESVACFAEAMQHSKYHAAALGYFGLCYASMGSSKHLDAISMLRDSLFFGSDTLVNARTIRMTLASLFLKPVQGQNRLEAIEQYAKVVESDPEDTEALVLRGGVLLVGEQLEESILDFTKCIQLLKGKTHDERYNHALYSRGRAYQRMGKYHDAIKDFESTSGTDLQNHDELLSNMASAYEALGEVDKALTCYGKMINSMDKSNAEDYTSVLHRRAALCSVCNMHDHVLRDLDEVIKLNPDDVKARHQRGSTLCSKYAGANVASSKEEDRQGIVFIREALSDFQAVLRLKPNHVQARLRRKEVCNILNETLDDD